MTCHTSDGKHFDPVVHFHILYGSDAGNTQFEILDMSSREGSRRWNVSTKLLKGGGQGIGHSGLYIDRFYIYGLHVEM